ncbi:HNH endonuclease [Nonomuraea fuscirosea]|uniref:HNH endonuclease n=1 Tax=Nonomuraea fuscirosea TaxID=1291556 RepID=A0A2T0M565_9ACTN|nr:HNH endonuclease [Nonomuraea fuscirosea]
MRHSPHVDVGQRYGHWLVLRHIRGAVWLCQCRCGTERRQYASSLLHLKTLSCGCWRKRNVPKPGDQIGEWLILSYDGPPNRMAWCRCSCGVEKSVDIYTLGKDSMSCGHARRITYTGNPDTKRCSKCLEEKLRVEFNRDSSSGDGLKVWCKNCSSAYYRANRERILSRGRLLYRFDRERKIAKTRAYHLANRDWSRRVHRDYHQKHRAEAYRRYVERGKDPEIRARRREASRRSESRRRALKKLGAADFITRTAIEKLNVMQSGCCWVCERRFEEHRLKIHLDHFKPLAAGGPHRLSNLVLMCSTCNIRKNSRWPFTEEMRLQLRHEVLAAAIE